MSRPRVWWGRAAWSGPLWPRVRRGPLRSLAAALIAVAVVAGCTEAAPTGSEPEASGSAQVSAAVADGQPTTVSADGVTVTVPAGGAQTGTTLTLQTAPAQLPDGLSDWLEVTGPQAQAQLDGATLAAPATVTFPVPTQVDGEPVDGGAVVPVVVWEDGAGGWRWLPTDWAPGATTISATTDHFSTGFLATVRSSKIAQSAAPGFRDYVTGRSGVAQPTCGDEDAARQGSVSVTSDSGDTVKWCFGVENGQRVLKVANNRRTYTQVDFPDTWTVVDATSLSFEPQTLARAFGDEVTFPTRPATDARILNGGDVLTLVVPDAGGQVTASLSSAAFILDALFFGVTTLGGGADLGLASAATAGSWSRIADQLSKGDGAASGYEDALQDCSQAIFENLGGADTPGTPELLKYAWNCVPALMIADLQAVGQPTYLAGKVLSVLGAVLSFGLTATHLLVAGMRELWDAGATLFGDSDSNIYDVYITPRSPAPGPAGFVGFQTPSGNISCFINSGDTFARGVARCDVVNHEWTAPPQPAGVCDPRTGGSYGNTLVVTANGAQFACPSGLEAIDQVANYDTWIVRGDFACLPGQRGVFCTRIGTDDGFFVSRGSYQLVGG